MALSIKGILSASYEAVVTDRNNKGFNQWSESAFLRALDKNGFIKRKDLGGSIEVPLDYQINAGAAVLATDITATSLSKTDILGTASYSIAEISVPIVWTKKDDATNPSQNQKVDYVKQLLENGMNSHDAKIEECLAAASATNGFESFLTLITEDGTGTIGGIVAGTDTFWKNQFKDYTTATGATLLGELGTVYNSCSKGSGSANQPTLIATSPTQFGVFEAATVANQRFVDADEANAGFKTYAFRNAQVVFSNAYSSDSYFFLNPKALQLIVSKSHFRHQGEVNEVDAANAYVTKIYSALQLVTTNRSRLGVSFT
jgi:hypothetical protein